MEFILNFNFKLIRVTWYQNAHSPRSVNLRFTRVVEIQNFNYANKKIKNTEEGKICNLEN